MRIPIIAGNWKMNKGASEAASFVSELVRAAGETRAETVVCPPFTSIPAAIAAARGTTVSMGAQDPSLNPQPSTLNRCESVRVGAQDLFWKESGAYTGQVAPGMLTELGVTHVIIGHSERRGRFGVPEEGFTPEVLALFGESDCTVNLKTRAALKHGLVPIVCCGETLAERRAGDTDRVVQGQIERGLAGLDSERAAGLVIAYEPVWAIGTGETCAPEEADRVCGVIRASVGSLYGADAAGRVRVQYGGSVKPDNAADLLSRPNIDGALVGGASLKVADFLAILQAA